ncbi:MAG TPA: MFS transporter [Ktedonobacteraceae bacterium]|nr:MFS transporter [Ktedonobacteraceae bacterium]
MRKHLAHRSRLHYGWIVASITFLTLLAAAGMRSTPGVLIVPLEHEFGWSSATISLAVSINLVLFGLSGPFAAALIQRFGVKWVMLGGLLLVAIAASCTTLMNEPWELDLFWGILVGLATGSISSVLGAIVADRWFSQRRGFVTGLLSASNATGQLVFLPLLASVVVSSGWRIASFVVAGSALLITPIVALFMRERPQDIGLQPYGAVETQPVVESQANPLTAAFGGLMRGLRSQDFWLLAGSFFICGLTTNGLIGTHLIPASMDHGIPEVTAASMLALIGIFDLIGTTVSGWLSDRIDNRVLLCWYYALRGLALLWLPYALGSSWLSFLVFIVFYGLDWVATVPPTARLTADLFGKEQMGVVYGWIFASHQLGAATAAFGAGVLRTWLGNYQVTFLIGGLFCLVAAGMVIRIGRTSRNQAIEVDLPVVPSASSLS